MKLYYKPGACSLASHMVLEEIGVDFKLDKVDTDAGTTENGDDYRAVNAKGYVPSLRLESDDVLTEGPSILQFLADNHPGVELNAKPGSVERAKVTEYLNYVGSELHHAFSPLFSANASEDEKNSAKETVAEKLNYVTTLLKDKDYLLGQRFTIADAYLSVVCNWSNFVGIDLSNWPTVRDYVGRVLSRPAAQRALKSEGLA